MSTAIDISGSASHQAAGLAFVTDAASAAAARDCFSQLDIGKTQVELGDIRMAIGALAACPSPKILIADISGIDDPLARIRALADVCDPSTSVFIIGEQNDIALYREIQRLGVSGYQFKPIVLDLLVPSCRAALNGEDDEDSRPRVGKLVTIIGVRSGVGCTTIAVNAAWYLATEMGRDVILIDLDLQSGDAALQLNVEPTHALRAALEHPDRIDDVFLERASIKVAPKLHLFAGLESLKDPIVPNAAVVMQIVTNVRKRHNYVLVDASSRSGLNFEPLEVASSTVCLVADPPVSSAREMLRWHDYMKSVRVGGTIRRILNKSGAPGGLSEHEFVTAIGGAPDTVIRFDPEIVRGGNLGQPAIDSRHAFRRSLAPLFIDLSGVPDVEPPGLLARIFRR